MLTKAAPIKRVLKSASAKISQQFSQSIKAHKLPLAQSDPDLFKIIKNEEFRQKEGINLIASENHSSLAVREAQGSVLTDKYAEGYPKARYYGGNQFIDQVELMCQKRALEAFHLDSKQWGVNVQPCSGSPANFITYSALMEPQERMMGLHLPHGGHLSHGFQTETKKLTAPAKYFQVLSYKLNEKTGLIDYDKLEYMAKEYRPKLIVTGASCYPRIIDVERIRKICDQINAVLVYDMAHISGLVAAKAIPSPFMFSDIVTTTTHKTLRGPRGGMIFYKVGSKGKNKKGVEEKFDFKQKIDNAVFPFFQGGPHMHVIASIATALKEAQSESFKNYAFQILKNAKVFEQKLLEKKYTLISGGTDNHLVWIDLKPKKIDGARVEDVLEAASIYVNKNTTPSDISAVVPSGLRIGTPAVTTRGLVEKDCEQVIEFVDRGISITKNIQDSQKFQKLADFKKYLAQNKEQIPEIVTLKNEVLKFMQKFEPLF